MNLTLVDIGGILPEIILVVYACLILLLEAFTSKTQRDFLAYTSLVALALAGYATARLMWVDLPVMGGLFLLDPYSNYFKIIFFRF